VDDIVEEPLEDVDDFGVDLSDEQAPAPTKVLRLKLD
jgi:hypothetical protein